MEKLDLVKLALMCAASGRHNIMLVGPAGCGKTIALQRLAGLLPPLTNGEAESVNRIKSLAGLMPLACNSNEEWLRPPFRVPHMSASIEGMCGGQAWEAEKAGMKKVHGVKDLKEAFDLTL